MNATPRRVSVARRRYLAALANAGGDSGDEAGSSDDEDENAHSTGSDSSDESMSPEKLCTLDVVRRVAVFLSLDSGSHLGVRPDESPASVAPATPLLGGHEQGGSPVASASPARIQRSPEELASSPLLGSHKQDCIPLVSGSPARIQRSPEELASALDTAPAP